MVESVVINTAEETSGPTLEEQAAAMDAAVSDTQEVQLPSDEGSTVDRPEWLPEKFETPEDMARSYAALEAKMSTSPTAGLRASTGWRSPSSAQVSGQISM